MIDSSLSHYNRLRWLIDHYVIPYVIECIAQRDGMTHKRIVHAIRLCTSTTQYSLADRPAKHVYVIEESTIIVF